MEQFYFVFTQMQATTTTVEG